METFAWNFLFADDAPEKKKITESFFDSLADNLYEIFISEVVIRELNNAPEPKKSKLFNLLNKYAPMELASAEEVNELADKYIERGIIPEGKRNDALHVAFASVYELDAVITWNYQHLANLRKSELFNAVNMENGYTKRLELVTAAEVNKYED